MAGDTRADVGSAGRSLLFSSFLLTGATALVFEVIWTRLLLLSLGATAVAVGAVLGAFMGGMAVGAFVAGRPRVARLDPIFSYALLEGWAGVYGLATPLLLGLTATLSPPWQLGLGIALLMPATIGMGASLPILTRALGQGSSWIAVDVGRLYAANTAGAVFGPLVAVFWLFPGLGLRSTLHVASALDVLVCVVLVASRRGVFPPWTAAAPVARAGPAPRTVVEGDTLLLVALSVSGAVAMVYEVTWTRVLSLAFASSVYGVTIMLSAFLAGLAGGSAWASTALDRARATASFRTVSWLLGGAALGAWLSLPVGHALPRIFLALHGDATGKETTLFLTQFVVAALLMLPTALCLGALLPVAASVPLPEKREVGERIARLYTANLVGSATGAVLASAVLMGQYGISVTVRLASAVALATALGLLIRTRGLSARQAAAAGVSLAFLLALSPGGRAMAKGIGFYSAAAYQEYDASGLRRVLDAHRLLYYRDGPTATVAVHEVGGYRLLKINGKTDASNGPGDMQTQVLLAHLPLMLHEDAKHVAVVGWGSGVTAGAALSYPGVGHVDAFEIEPAVIEASKQFEDVNGDPLDDPRLELLLGDARARLRRSARTYDVIISEPSNPWITGISNLFTREYFRILDSRLAPGGVVCQWFHLYGMSEGATRSLVATFASVFPEQLLFRLSSGRDVLLLGSHDPIRFSLPRMRRVFEDPERGKILSSVGLQYPFDVLVELTLDTRGCAEFAGGAPLNTDDNMRLELSAPRTLYVDRTEEIAEALREHQVAVVDHVSDDRGRGEILLDEAASLFTAGRHEEALATCQDAIGLDPSFAAYRLRGQILQALGRNEEARRAFEFVLGLGGTPEERALVEALLRSLGRQTDEG